MEKKSRLGRGLDALVGNGPEANDDSPNEQPQVALDQIERNPYQPRRTFDSEELSALSDSIRMHGVLQPLVVRPVGDRYQLVAGERRLRAAQAVGLSEVPIRVVDFNDQQVLEAALVENIHRTDLNPIEKAQGFKEYLTRFKMSHEHLATRLGMARPTITNLLSLLELPAEVQEAVRTGQLSPAHAKLLKGTKDQEWQVRMCKEIIARGLSVHATEAFMKQPQVVDPNGAATDSLPPPKPSTTKTNHVKAIEDELQQSLAVRVEIRQRSKDKGQIVLYFQSNDDFERLVELLRK